MKLLLADDEPDMIRALSAILTHEGYKVDAVYDGAEALEKAAAVSYDGLILDIMMPKLDGLAVLSALRDKDILTPVLLLTAKSQTEDKISGLDCGADDYLTKPFDIGEFLARVRALTRRSAAKQLSGLTCGNFTLDRASMELSCGTSSVCLSSREAAMLELFIREEGRLLTETQLLEHTWGSTSYDDGASEPTSTDTGGTTGMDLRFLSAKKDAGAGRQPEHPANRRGISSDGGGRMIRSLRRRFLLIAMFSLALTLFVIGGSINLGNYIRLTDRRMPSSRLFMKMTGISPLSGIIQTFRDVSNSPAKRSLRHATALFIWMKMRNHPTSTPSTSPPSVRATSQL